MSTTLDTRPPTQQDANLAIRPGQNRWDDYQLAALAQIGLKDASNADRAVFLHQCQRTGLDPFARQIYMIGRNEKQRDGSWGTKWTIQTGIDGWRVIRDRAEKRAGVRGVLGREIWYDHEGNEFKVWVRPDAPAACEITYTVRDANGETPYTSVLQFAEYVQTKDGKPIAQWAVKGSHMLAKCTEADVYRKAFPQDFAGISLEDAMPPADAAPPPANGRVTAADIRGRARPQVRGEVVHGPTDVSPAAEAPSAPPPLAEPAGEAPARPAMATGGQAGIIDSEFERLGWNLDDPDDQGDQLRTVARLARVSDITAITGQLPQDKAAEVIAYLKRCGDVHEIRALLDDGEVPGGE